MARELLARMRSLNALNPEPGDGGHGSVHVPFDDLTHTASYEEHVAGAALRGERIALIGSSGSGKTSLTEHVFFFADVRPAAPIRIEVALETAPIATDPVEFCRHVIRTYGNLLAHHSGGNMPFEVDRIVGEAFDVSSGPTATSATVGAGPSWLHGEVAYQLDSAMRQLSPSAADVIEQAQLMIRIVATNGFKPVLVLDDTDHWTHRPGLPSRDEVLAAFFGPVVRVIAEHMSDAAVVIPVHEDYLDSPHYQPAREFLATEITLPTMSAPDQLGVILGRRAAVSVGLPPADVHHVEVIDPDALALMHANYRDGHRSIRRFIRDAHAALIRACDTSSDTIAVRHVEQAID